MNMLIGLIKLFLFNCKLKISSGMQYRIDFFLGLLVSLGMSSIGPVFQYLYFSHSNGYPNWNIKQIILFQGFMLLWFGIKDMLFGEIREKIVNLVRAGGFDMILLKPYPAVGIILSNGFYYQGFGPIIAGLVIIIYMINNISLHINIYQIGLIIFFYISGIILYMGITIIYCSIALLIVFMSRLGEIIDKLLQFSQYPVDIFLRIIRIAFIMVFPIAIWAYLPTQTLLNRIDITVLFSILSCIVFFLISLIFWNICLKKYTSAGG